MNSPLFEVANSLEDKILNLKTVSDLLWANGHSLETETLSGVGILIREHLKPMNDLVSRIYEIDKQIKRN